MVEGCLIALFVEVFGDNRPLGLIALDWTSEIDDGGVVGSVVDTGVTQIHIVRVDIRLDVLSGGPRIDETFGHATIAQNVTVVEIGTLGVHQFERIQHLRCHGGIVIRHEVPPMVPPEFPFLRLGHGIVAVEILGVDPMTGIVGIERPEVLTVMRCDGPAQGFIDELPVVHVYLIGEPSAV